MLTVSHSTVTFQTTEEKTNLTILGELELHGTGDLLHSLGLSRGSYTRHGQTDVDSWSDSLVEQLSLEEDLSVSDGNHIGGNVRGHITGLSLDDRQSGQRSTTERVVHLGGTFEKTRVEVEHITRVGLTTGRTTQQQRHLTVGDGLLGQIVVDDQGVLAVVTEELSHGASGIRRQELQWSSVGGRRRHDNGVLHGSGVGQTLHDLGDSGSLLSDGDVDTVQLLLLVSASVETGLVDDGVNGNGGLSETETAITNGKSYWGRVSTSHGISSGDQGH